MIDAVVYIDMASYSIKDIEHLSGIKAHTLRIWEKRYNILDPKRTSTNIRYYDDEDLKKILNISILNRNGYKISTIASLPNYRLGEEILNITQNNGSIDGQIESLIMAMVDFDEHRFEKAFNKSLMSIGFEETILKLIYPFFEKIGILWQTGNVNPAQEHFVSNLIRQKLIVAIDDLSGYPLVNPKNFLLFLPEDEWHEIGLLFYSYLIRKNGHKVIYLGTSVPLDSVLEMEKYIPVSYLVTTVKTTKTAQEAKNYLYTISSFFSDKKIFLLGSQLVHGFPELPKNIITPSSLEDFKVKVKSSIR